MSSFTKMERIKNKSKVETEGEKWKRTKMFSNVKIGQKSVTRIKEIKMCQRRKDRFTGNKRQRDYGSSEENITTRKCEYIHNEQESTVDLVARGQILY